jgi:hypothetical protein
MEKSLTKNAPRGRTITTQTPEGAVHDQHSIGHLPLIAVSLSTAFSGQPLELHLRYSAHHGHMGRKVKLHVRRSTHG